MTEKESLGVKIIKRFYGITGVYDEYKKQQVNQIGNKAFMALWVYMMVSSIVAFLFGVAHPEWTLWILLLANGLFGVIGIGGYIMYATISNDITNYEVEEKNYEKEKKKMKKKAIKVGIEFGLWMFLFNEVFGTLFNEEKLLQSLTLKSILLHVASGLFFGGIMYVIGVTNINRIDE